MVENMKMTVNRLFIYIIKKKCNCNKFLSSKPRKDYLSLFVCTLVSPKLIFDNFNYFKRKYEETESTRRKMDVQLWDSHLICSIVLSRCSTVDRKSVV